MARRTTKKKDLTPEEKLAQALVPVEEQPYRVPGNWCWTYVGAVCSFVGGGTPSKSNSNYWDGSIPWASVKDVKGDYLFDTIDHITELGYNNSATNIANEGELILVTRIEPGKTIITTVRTAINQDLKIVKSLVPASFLQCYFRTFQNEFELKSSGSTVKGITVANVEKNIFPLPPLPEQQRIVARIESLFAKLDEAKEKAQAVVDGFEERKAAILHKAFTGELTKKWRKANGKDNEQWAECVLLSLLIEKPRNGYSPKPVSYETSCKSMTLSATTSGFFRPEYFKYVDEAIPEDSYLWLKPGDILIQRANSIEKVGTSAIYTGKEHEFIYPDLMMKLQVDERVDANYIAYYLKTEKVMTYLRANATGTAGNMPKINQKVVSNIPVSLPSKNEQREIVLLLDGLFGKEQQAKSAAEQVLDQIDTMKKAILARAFRGELGTNDAGEESAVELVKGIMDEV